MKRQVKSEYFAYVQILFRWERDMVKNKFNKVNKDLWSQKYKFEKAMYINYLLFV